MEKRELLFTQEHFSEVISYFAKNIDETIQDVNEHPEEYKLSNVYYSLYLNSRKLLTAKYSAGYPIIDLKDNAEQALNWLIKNIEHPEHDRFYLDDLEDYLNLLQLLSFGVIFNIDKSITLKLLNLYSVNNKKAKDSLIDKLALHLQPHREQSNKLQHPKAYQSLFDAINATKEEQAKHMHKFLKGWYKSMRKCGWHDVHLSVGKDVFPGYWCWEAAMVTLLYNIDDSSYQDMPFYPKDMVDYARQQKL
ncbi:hypothetical protein ASE74_15840 [Pedobacter sp. Leaf216]|uniref:PoNe immunity protein domain-containing protein n=1 Tax=Pedobacter sp. Leaf216 TaxID=1735684 RepID=UPI0006F9B279|nr:PoNe immunity protein domain-containing protein [Pedobacter sp. Leaf216]KQM77870.1 hypothetical protein ASE74_15840 [Pedobacter sp. Leaf216]